VVAYTFNAQGDAEKKAHSINSKHPALKAEVFSPNANTGPYLVIVGGQMSREKAAAERRTALRAGLPRDTYVQNYQQ
jgi:hypothetical protein